MKRIKAIVCAALSVCVVAVPLFSSVAFNAGAEEKTIQEKIAELDAKSEEYQAVLDQAENDISEKEAYSEALVSKISVLNEKVILTKESIEKINANIKTKQLEIDKGNEEIDGQIDALCERLNIIYMAGSAGNLEILLGAKDFDDFIDKITLVKTLSEYDKELIDEVNGKLSVIEEQKKKLEAEKTSLEVQQASLNVDISDLNKLLDENKAVLAELSKKSENARAALKNANSKTAELEAEAAKQFAEEAAAAAKAQAQSQAAAQAQAAVQAQIAKQRAAEQQRKQAADGSTDSGDSGSTIITPSESGYTWPCPGYYYLSSLWNEDRTTYNHGAIDIAGGDILGAPVVAADDGVVTDTFNGCVHNWGKDFSESCGCGGGYGNYVWISHGNGKETIYGHFTSVVVSPGQTVSKGQVIGYVGTTGHSTGPHLHFECRINGEKYNPMDELSAYWGMVSY